MPMFVLEGGIRGSSLVVHLNSTLQMQGYSYCFTMDKKKRASHIKGVQTKIA